MIIVTETKSEYHIQFQDATVITENCVDTLSWIGAVWDGRIKAYRCPKTDRNRDAIVSQFGDAGNLMHIEGSNSFKRCHNCNEWFEKPDIRKAEHTCPLCGVTGLYY